MMAILQIFLFISLIAFSDSISLQTLDGDIVECIHTNKQLAFTHPLLGKHNIQNWPTDIPTITERKKKNKWQTSEAYVSTVNCPEGTIPVRQNGTTLNRAYPETSGDTGRHEYAEVSTQEPLKLYGMKATINIWDPKVETVLGETSISQIWITSGDYKSNDLNTIEVGWQVCPEMYLDYRPRLFIYWTSDTYQTTGGYNLEEAGFIQTSNKIVLGGAIAPVSSSGGSQYEITFLVWKDRRSGNWWLGLGPNNSVVGYWPGEIFTTLADYANTISLGGEIVDSHHLGRHTKTQMGSGHYPEEGFGKASYFRNIEILGDNNDNTFQPQPINQLDFHEEGTYYKIKKLDSDEWGTHFFYGGPGFSYAHSGVVPPRLSLFSIYFTFSLFIII